jgi:hypothetical protein
MRDTVPSFAVEGRAIIGLPPFRCGPPPHEVHLPADPAVEIRAQRVRAHLPREIDLQRRVDRHHLVVLRDDERIVRVFGGVELAHRVVIDELEHLARAEHERGHDLALVKRLARAVDDPF